MRSQHSVFGVFASFTFDSDSCCSSVCCWWSKIIFITAYKCWLEQAGQTRGRSRKPVARSKAKSVIPPSKTTKFLIAFSFVDCVALTPKVTKKQTTHAKSNVFRSTSSSTPLIFLDSFDLFVSSTDCAFCDVAP